MSYIGSALSKIREIDYIGSRLETLSRDYYLSHNPDGSRRLSNEPASVDCNDSRFRKLIAAKFSQM
jgi:hypothetical protein